MVGSSPFTGSRQTTVPTRILPIRLVFADGTVLDGSDNVGNLVASPLFQPANFISGKTQYGDAVQRAEFWKETEGTNYHVWLAQPLVRPTTTIHVPAGYGQVYHLQSGVTIGQVRIGWFFYHVITKLLHSQNIQPTVLPIYVTQDILLQFGNNPNACCVFGFHGAENNGLNTYAWSSYLSPGIFAPRYGLRDVNGFSHEISEWYNDPFVNNIVPEWFTPTAPQYGCTNALESGDPLVGFSFNKNGYSLQDEAFYLVVRTRGSLAGHQRLVHAAQQLQRAGPGLLTKGADPRRWGRRAAPTAVVGCPRGAGTLGDFRLLRHADRLGRRHRRLPCPASSRASRDERLLEVYHRIEPQVQAERYRTYREVMDLTTAQVADERGGRGRTDETALSESLQHWPAFPEVPGRPGVRPCGAAGSWRSCPTATAT